MMDKETIKKALILCSFEGFPDTEMGCDASDKCPYWMHGCITSLTDDAYLLIDEQDRMHEPKKVEVLMVTPRHNKGIRHGRCPGCDEWINDIANSKCCGKCGQEVRWNG